MPPRTALEALPASAADWVYINITTTKLYYDVDNIL